MHIHLRQGQGKVGVSHKDMGGDAQTAPNYVFGTKPAVKAVVFTTALNYSYSYFSYIVQPLGGVVSETVWDRAREGEKER